MRTPIADAALAATGAAFLLAMPARASGTCELAAHPELLSCKVIVTGTDMRSRPEGLTRCVRDVVVKVTGRPDLAGDARLDAIARDAASLVEDLAYLDRMTDIPTHDEQGSRDRPFDLVAHVNPVTLSARLAHAGLRPWLSRPTVLVLVSVTERGGDTFPLTGDGASGERQRQALLAAGALYGVRVALPTVAQVERIGFENLRPGSAQIGGGPTAVLRGTLRWSDQDPGWSAEWQADAPGAPGPWNVRGVSFDEAYRTGVGGAAEALSKGRRGC